MQGTIVISGGFKKLFFAASLVLFIAGSTIQAQDNKAYLTEGTLEEQFNHVIDKSSSWENYKMITNSWINTLRRNTLDTLTTAKKEIALQKSLANEKEETIVTLQNTLEETQSALNLAVKEKNSFRILGLNISKGLFLTITWLIIIGLAGLSFVSIGLYKRSFSVIQKNKEELSKITDEFEKYRQEARLKQEQLVIQHHKEIQKLKGI